MLACKHACMLITKIVIEFGLGVVLLSSLYKIYIYIYETGVEVRMIMYQVFEVSSGFQVNSCFSSKDKWQQLPICTRHNNAAV